MDLDSVCEDLYSLWKTFLQWQLLSAYCLAFESEESRGPYGTKGLTGEYCRPLDDPRRPSGILGMLAFSALGMENLGHVGPH